MQCTYRTWNRLCLFWILAKGTCLSLIYSSIEDNRHCNGSQWPLEDFIFSQHLHVCNTVLCCAYLYLLYNCTHYIHCNARINSFICRYPQTKAGWSHPSYRQSGFLNTMLTRRKHRSIRQSGSVTVNTNVDKTQAMQLTVSTLSVSAALELWCICICTIVQVHPMLYIWTVRF